MNKTNSWQRCLKCVDTAKEYIAAPENYIRFFDVTINGKLRHLVTYMPNESGAALRILHNNVAEFLQTKYRQARSSYAYAKGKSFLQCVNRHLNSDCFLKTDIHSYFDSISYDFMLKRIAKLRMPQKDRDILGLLVKACFYKGKLPLGYTSSPVLSDFFLVTLDRKYQKNKSIIYTRYADDFIVSTSGIDARKELKEFRLQLEKDLDKLDLELNKKKTYIRQLKEPGDAIHVLGINIVKTDKEQNRITISDGYIRETCKLLCEWLRSPCSDDDENELLKLYGRISFIKQCSQDSFAKLKKMTRIKCDYSGPLTIKALRIKRGFYKTEDRDVV